jgi:kumamolisin
VPPRRPPPVTRLGATDIRQDLALFDRLFALPAADLKVTTSLASGASPYLANNEEVGDAEMVHAIAPGAAIQVILLPGVNGSTKLFISELAEGLRLAPRLGGVVSISGGRGEQCTTPAEMTALDGALQADRDQGATVVAASGDAGAASIPCTGSDGTVSAPKKGANLPASDPLVLAAGGTSLRADHVTGAYQGETAWNTPTPAAVAQLMPPGLEAPVASGGGFSSIFSRPSYQAGAPGTEATRGVPDVAASAGRHLGFINPAIYLIGSSREYHSAFHDVVTGDNTVNYPSGSVSGYRAAPGWDPVTGWGSPDAQILVPLLAARG